MAPTPTTTAVAAMRQRGPLAADPRTERRLVSFPACDRPLTMAVIFRDQFE